MADNQRERRDRRAYRYRLSHGLCKRQTNVLHW